METIPIATLTPDSSPADKAIKAVVTLIWPYSSSTHCLALLLAEPDFRLRNRRGQVRVKIEEPAATTVAKSAIGINDVVTLVLDGARWVQKEDGIVDTPGRSVEWELVYSHKITLSAARDGQDAARVEIDEPVEDELEPDVRQDGLVRDVHTPYSRRAPAFATPATVWSSPAFHKRARVSGGADVDSPYDPFTEPDGTVPGKGRKRARKSWKDIGVWSYAARTPSPQKEEMASAWVGDDASEASEDVEPLEAAAVAAESLRSPVSADVEIVAKETTVQDTVLPQSQTEEVENDMQENAFPDTITTESQSDEVEMDDRHEFSLQQYTQQLIEAASGDTEVDTDVEDSDLPEQHSPIPSSSVAPIEEDQIPAVSEGDENVYDEYLQQYEEIDEDEKIEESEESEEPEESDESEVSEAVEGPIRAGFHAYMRDAGDRFDETEEDEEDGDSSVKDFSPEEEDQSDLSDDEPAPQSRAMPEVIALSDSDEEEAGQAEDESEKSSSGIEMDEHRSTPAPEWPSRKVFAPPQRVMPPPALPFIQTSHPGDVEPAQESPRTPTLGPVDSAGLPLPSPFPGAGDSSITSYMDQYMNQPAVEENGPVVEEAASDDLLKPEKKLRSSSSRRRSSGYRKENGPFGENIRSTYPFGMNPDAESNADNAFEQQEETSFVSTVVDEEAYPEHSMDDDAEEKPTQSLPQQDEEEVVRPVRVESKERVDSSETSSAVQPATQQPKTPIRSSAVIIDLGSPTDDEDEEDDAMGDAEDMSPPGSPVRRRSPDRQSSPLEVKMERAPSPQLATEGSTLAAAQNESSHDADMQIDNAEDGSVTPKATQYDVVPGWEDEDDWHPPPMDDDISGIPFSDDEEMFDAAPVEQNYDEPEVEAIDDSHGATNDEEMTEEPPVQHMQDDQQQVKFQEMTEGEVVQPVLEEPTSPLTSPPPASFFKSEDSEEAKPAIVERRPSPRVLIKPEPFTPKKGMAKSQTPLGSLGDKAGCFDCSVKKTPLWRKSPDGQVLCNACYLHRRTHGGRPKPRRDEKHVEIVEPKIKEEDTDVINCICGNNVEQGHEILCDNCNTWQHVACYYASPDAKDLPDVHECEECRPGHALRDRTPIQPHHGEHVSPKLRTPPKKAVKYVKVSEEGSIVFSDMTLSTNPPSDAVRPQTAESDVKGDEHVEEPSQFAQLRDPRTSSFMKLAEATSSRRTSSTVDRSELDQVLRRSFGPGKGDKLDTDVQKEQADATVSPTELASSPPEYSLDGQSDSRPVVPQSDATDENENTLMTPEPSQNQPRLAHAFSPQPSKQTESVMPPTPQLTQGSQEKRSLSRPVETVDPTSPARNTRSSQHRVHESTEPVVLVDQTPPAQNTRSNQNRIHESAEPATPRRSTRNTPGRSQPPAEAANSVGVEALRAIRSDLQRDIDNARAARKSMVRSPPQPQEDSLATLVESQSSSQSKPAEPEPQTQRTLAASSGLGIRTPLSYYTSLSHLRNYLNVSSQDASLDIIAPVIRSSKAPERAKSGPRDWYTLFSITDKSIFPARVQVQVFRPWKSALPEAEKGDVVLLRGFSVFSRKGKIGLQSGEASAWAVWRFEDDGTAGSSSAGGKGKRKSDGDASAKPPWAKKKLAGVKNPFAGGGVEEVRGPPVELGREEREEVGRFRTWWRGVEAGSGMQMETQGMEGLLAVSGGGK
ncbi:hypothetical protein K402DRAFT_398563 [Aulographum hederae CBS 113979]|uniref:GATA-type domain-containing protein n=1 Tax=Aulographum hederae CBS 113979 TaxID=1176131 RepID=A0A6G1GK94_9PEZI|nr:hypothetical protein K402DRAFT_398563 [Aulographum hederae CBS 113979]